MSFYLQAPQELFTRAQAAGVDIEKEVMSMHTSEGDRLPEVHNTSYGNVFVMSTYHRKKGGHARYHVFVITEGKLVWDCSSSLYKSGGMGYAEAHAFAANVCRHGVRSQLGMQVMSAVLYGWHRNIDYSKL